MPVTISPNGEATSFAGEDGTSLFQAIALKSALRLHKVGIRINRYARNKDLLYTAGKITGQRYKPKDFDRAILDLSNWIEQAKAQTEIIQQ